MTVPALPRGGSVGFQFGDERRGWVTRVPESLQLPAVAYGAGKVFVSGGFETYSFYALDAEEGDRLGLRPAPRQRPHRPAVRRRSGHLRHRELHAGRARRPHRQAALVEAARRPDAGPAGGGRRPGVRIPPGRRGLPAVRLPRRHRRRGLDPPRRERALRRPRRPGDSVYASAVGGRATGSCVRRAPSLVAPAARHDRPLIADGELFVSRRDRGGEAESSSPLRPARSCAPHAPIAAPYLVDVPHDVSDWKRCGPSRAHARWSAVACATWRAGWTIEAADTRSGAPYWVRTRRQGAGVRSVGTVALAGSAVVVSTRAGQLYGLDVDTGYTLWAYDIGHRVLAEPIVARGGSTSQRPTAWSSPSRSPIRASTAGTCSGARTTTTARSAPGASSEPRLGARERSCPRRG